ncbi:serine hydrolase domain-containing protein [Nonomuraea sp. 10N515B]|uniref:serine hydrolase domain-containing protein n=1 Tax=Nonomuraea sp. 10N515B TaxID=3457422 RepID=UPI003FCC5EF6
MDQLEMKAIVDEILNRRPAVGLALGVVRNGALEFFHGHGVADIASNTPITEDTVFRIASITKTFTAIAVMQLWEQGLIDLDAPADDYLRAYQLTPARPAHRAATVRHLLTHTAGVPQMVYPTQALRSGWFGESVEIGRPLPTLAEHYRGDLRLAAEPGTTFTYTDHGFATLGQIVADVSGQPLEGYLCEHVFEPLGMTDTSLVRSDRITSRLATGYRLAADGPKPIVDRQWITAAAASAYSTPRDMARYLAVLAGGGANEHGSVLKPATLASMYEPHYQPDPRVPGIGLAFFRADLGGHPAIEHQGILPGFNAQIFVAPRQAVGVMAFTNGARNALMWLPAETGRLLGHAIDAPDAAIRTAIPHHPEIWGDLVGWYRPHAQLTDMQTWSMVGAGTEVVVRRGRLWLRALSPIPALYRGFLLHPDDEEDPYVFRIDLSDFGLATARVVFSREPGPRSIHLDLAPLTLQKRPTATNPRVWVSGALIAASAAVAIRRIRYRRA